MATRPLPDPAHPAVDLLLVPFGTTWPELRDAARVAADAGFAGLWTWDHLRPTDGDPNGAPECWTVLSALAALLPGVTVGPLVLNVANRHPALVANMAATLQQVSAGRLVLGLGAGGGARREFAPEQHQLGRPIPPDPVRRAQLAEAVAVLHHLWAGLPGDFRGEHFALRAPSGFLRPDPPPPVVVAGFGPKMAALAGRVGDGFNTEATHPELEELVAVAREAHRQAGGDPAGFAVTVFATLHDRWLDPASPERLRLREVGVHRIVLNVAAPYPLEAIAGAAATLARRGAAR